MRKRRLRILGGLLALGMVVSACGGSDGSSGGATGEAAADDGGDATSGETEEAPEAEAEGDGGGGDSKVIRFAFAPDPVWDYLKDTGELDKWSEETGYTIETSESWDEFTYFAGGHGDIVSMGTHELPLLEEEAGVKVVAFGKYNHQRVPLYTTAEDGYGTLADVPEGATTCANSAVSNTIVWSIIADKLHDINYRVGGGDFDIVVQDHFVMPELVVRGQCEVAAAIPEAAVPQLRTGELEVMYDGRPPWRVYQELCECDHEGIMSNLMVAREEWYDNNPEAAEAFLDLWQRGIELWNENTEEIVEKYPQHFAVEEQADVDWIKEYMAGENDWFVDSVYLDEAWIDEETKFYDMMVEGGWMEEGTALPRFEAIDPA